jgi:hypothetical protein
MERIALKLNDRYFELVKFENKFTCRDPRNNFIKISFKTMYPSQNGNVKINEKEFTLHPTKVQVNTKTKKRSIDGWSRTTKAQSQLFRYISKHRL